MGMEEERNMRVMLGFPLSSFLKRRIGKEETTENKRRRREEEKTQKGLR